MTCSDCRATNLTVTVIVDLGNGVRFELCRRCFVDTTTVMPPKKTRGKR